MRRASSSSGSVFKSAARARRSRAAGGRRDPVSSDVDMDETGAARSSTSSSSSGEAVDPTLVQPPRSSDARLCVSKDDMEAHPLRRIATVTPRPHANVGIFAPRVEGGGAIGRLPYDLLARIAGMLVSPVDVLALRTTCRQLRAAIDARDCSWAGVLQHHFWQYELKIAKWRMVWNRWHERPEESDESASGPIGAAAPMDLAVLSGWRQAISRHDLVRVLTGTRQNWLRSRCVASRYTLAGHVTAIHVLDMFPIAVLSGTQQTVGPFAPLVRPRATVAASLTCA